MSHSEKPSDGSPKSPCTDARVISLCTHRRRRIIEKHTRRLIGHLESIHRKAIEIHNHVLERAELSVLTEVCRTAGLCFDFIDHNCRAAVITPAALYGDSGGAIFGKKPLQERIAAALHDETDSCLFQRLVSAHGAVWKYEPRHDDRPTGLATPLAGPDLDCPREVAGVVVRSGQLSRRPGVYSGWLLSFEDTDYIVFGHRLDRRREVAVRNLLSTRNDLHDPEIWRSLELSLLRAIVDPDDRHQRADRTRFPEHSLPGIRYPGTRRGLLLAIRRTLWRHFAEPSQGLTIHAHIAALIDDPDSYDAFLDEVREIATTVTLKSGGLRDDDRPIEIHEILSSFFIDSKGCLLSDDELRAHPLEVLLLDDLSLEHIGLPSGSTVGHVLDWAEENRADLFAGHVESAWMNFRMEQNLMATYGHRPNTPPADPGEKLAFAHRSAVLPNIRTLFDPRFLKHGLADLSLSPTHLTRLQRGLIETGVDPDRFVLRDIDDDERSLIDLAGVGHKTCNAFRHALLDLATNWRFPSH